MEQEYYGDISSAESANGDPFVGAPGRVRGAKNMSGSAQLTYIDVIQGRVSSTTLPSPTAVYSAARLRYWLQRMQDFAPYRTTVFTAVPNGSGVATITINAEDLQADSVYAALQKLLPMMYFTFGASPTSAVPASQSNITITYYDSLGNAASIAFAIERNTAQMTKVRFTGFRLLFGKPVAQDIGAYATASTKPIVLTVTGLVGNANFSVEIPGLNDPRLASAYSALNQS